MLQEKVDTKRIINPDTGIFDFIVEHVDTKTKRIIGVNPYRMFAIGKETIVYERPVGSGHLYYKSGEAAGIFDYAEKEKAIKEKDIKNAITRAIKLGEAHKPWNPPVDGDELLMRENVNKEAKIAELEKELAAIRAERAPKAAAKV